MHVVIRRTKLGGPAKEAARRTHDLIVPLLEGRPGFRGYCAFRDEAEPDRAVSVSLFDSREDAVRSHERVVGTAREELGEMAYGTPEVTMGETAVLATA